MHSSVLFRSLLFISLIAIYFGSLRSGSISLLVQDCLFFFALTTSSLRISSAHSLSAVLKHHSVLFIDFSLTRSLSTDLIRLYGFQFSLHTSYNIVNAITNARKSHKHVTLCNTTPPRLSLSISYSDKNTQ